MTLTIIGQWNNIGSYVWSGGIYEKKNSCSQAQNNMWNTYVISILQYWK